MPEQNGSPSGARCHIVLIPGFGGFDALGRVEYYAGVTRLFQQWKGQHEQTPVVLHYFDNLPTAAVTTRAERLRSYLAKRMARNEILEEDEIVLVGHSTGGLDIRQLVCDLHDPKNAEVAVDGGLTVRARDIRKCLNRVVFLSVPHWGTNIADWVYEHAVLRKTVIADLRAALAGSQVRFLDRIEAGITEGAASLTGADLLLALRDAMTEANDRLCPQDDPAQIAQAQEAAADLELYFRHMATDFRVINDLTSQAYKGKTSPAHFTKDERERELGLWSEPRISVLSYVTVGGRPFRFTTPSGAPAPAFELKNLCEYPAIATGNGQSADTDVTYRLCYRACAGGPLPWPALTGAITRVLGPPPKERRLELWDNDGIVNTVSMPWPDAENTIVQCDHLDIVGQYHLEKTPAAKRAEEEQAPPPPRTHQSYDSLKSMPRFEPATFRDVWTDIFSFAATPSAFEQHKRSKPVRLATAANGG